VTKQHLAVALLTAAVLLSGVASWRDAARVRRIEAELGEIRALLRQQRESATNGRTSVVPAGRLSLAGSPTRGNPSALVALVEFFDYRCPFCDGFERSVLPEIDRLYIQTGRLLLALKHSPIEKLHPSAPSAAEAAVCADSVGGFWPFHELLVRNPIEQDREAVLRAAGELNLNVERFRRCLSDGRTGEQVRWEMAEAARFGITGTPGFLLGHLEDATVRVVRRIAGARPFAEFQAAIEDLLATR
jgi:protein-disulfide isomerase